MNNKEPDIIDSEKGFLNLEASLAQLSDSFKGGTADKGGDADSWLMTYTDMVTLLITLFIVMLAHSTFKIPEKDIVNKVETQNVITPKEPVIATNRLAQEYKLLRGSPYFIDAYKEEKGILPDNTGVLEGEETPSFKEEAEQELLETSGQQSKAPTSPDKLEEIAWLKKQVEDTGLGESVSINLQAKDISIAINEKVLFKSAEAKLNTEGLEVISLFAPMFKESDYNILVEGHTDSLPINTEKFPSNWELSAARAIAVVKFLISKQVPPEKMQAIAYAETKPVADNSTIEGKQRNRRVQIILKSAK